MNGLFKLQECSISVNILINSGGNNIGDKGAEYISKANWPNLNTIYLCTF